MREQLAGRRVLVTGVTGFVGEALLECVLSELPDTRLVVMVRPKPGRSGRARVERLVRAGAGFRRLREQLGRDGIVALLDERVEVVEGDLENVPALPADLDVVIHCAGEVSFDPAIDDGFRTNLLGVERLLAAVHAGGSRPHLVHVSTAYVAGIRKGLVPEAALDLDVDWRTEAAAALRVRGVVEDASRSPGRLRELGERAGKAVRGAGNQAVSAETERLRRAWVDEELVAAGRERARSLGWADCYTFTKALGERAAEELAGGLPLSVVRPSIIESALERPYPGWIEGFKMAEPIILAFGRAELPDFPAVPDAVIDVIPVDLVVHAILAVAASPPPPERPAYYHVSSGARNPLTFRGLYDNVTEYFTAHPFEARGRGAVAPPTWSFPGSHSVDRLLGAAAAANDAVDAVVTRLPRSAFARDRALAVDRRRTKLDFQRRYFGLYAAYTQAELVFADDNTLALHCALDPEEQKVFGCDSAVVDWRHYTQDVHFPSVTSSIRALAKRQGSAPARVARDLPAGDGVLAVFDLDGTLAASNVVESYLWLRLAADGPSGRARELAAVAGRLPGFLLAERRDRGALLRAVYSRFAGADVAELERLVDDEVGAQLVHRLSPAALRRVRAHRDAGHTTVLLTGAVEVLTRPLAPLFDVVHCTCIEVRDGRYTGRITGAPPVGEARAAWLRDHARRTGADLAASYAYADSISDLPMLTAVGNPVAVNPDVALARESRSRRWPVEQWPAQRGTPRRLLAAVGGLPR